MIHQLNIFEFLERSRGHLVLDVRSEGEYNYGHIINATSLPLFNNDERKLVGTAYKQQGKNEAILLGLDIVGKKMAEFIRFADPLIKDNKVFIHCWRGGMRSGSMAWLFDLFGREVFVLKGGYKAYRHYVLDIIAKDFKLIVVGGKTGCGKTSVLAQLAGMSEQVIDLEQLANHKGSAFGALGQPAQPSTEYFENMLADKLNTFDSTKRIWIEDESKSIGRVFIDLNLWKNMCTANIFVIELPLNIRVNRLIAEYAANPLEALEASLTAIKKRLGNEQWKNAIAALHRNDLEAVVHITLVYYDKAYDKSLAMRENKEIYPAAFEDDDVNAIALALITTANDKGL